MRGRKCSIRYYASKGGYFTEFQGKKYRLATGPDDAATGPTFLEALDAFKRLMELAHAPGRVTGTRYASSSSYTCDTSPRRRSPRR